MPFYINADQKHVYMFLAKINNIKESEKSKVININCRYIDPHMKKKYIFGINCICKIFVHNNN